MRECHLKFKKSFVVLKLYLNSKILISRIKKKLLFYSKLKYFGLMRKLNYLLCNLI